MTTTKEIHICLNKDKIIFITKSTTFKIYGTLIKSKIGKQFMKEYMLKTNLRLFLLDIPSNLFICFEYITIEDIRYQTANILLVSILT